jgi:hypothetical protein
MISFQEAADPYGVPESCTLPTAEQPLRVAEFDALFRTAVTGRQRTGATVLELSLTPEPEVAAAAAALAVRESRCCSFFRFALTVAPREVQLIVRVPETHVAVLDAVADRVAAARG